MKTKYYLLEIYGDVEPIRHGPYQTDRKRTDAARRLKKLRGDRDGIFRFDATGDVSIRAFSNHELEQNEEK